MTNQAILREIVELVEVSDINEVARLLSSGKWIAVHATLKESVVFCLGRVRR